jgi:predicted transcriptional regulator of viral defense system
MAWYNSGGVDRFEFRLYYWRTKPYFIYGYSRTNQSEAPKPSCPGSYPRPSSAHPVFSRTEYAAAVGRRPDDKVVTAMLTQHLQAGNIRRIARGVFASVPKHADAGKWSVDRFLAASRLRRGSVIAYHSALELHGCAYTEGHEVQVIARGEPGVFEAVGLNCRFVKPPRGFAPDDVTVVDRLGLEVSVTTIERTIADLFDRYDLAGGAEELFNSLDLVARVDAAALLRHARALGNATAAGALGSWLEREQNRLGVPGSVLEELRKLMPTQARYALGAKSGEGRTAKGWNVILPIDVVERRFEGL